MFAKTVKNFFICLGIPVILFIVLTILSPGFGFNSLPVVFSQSIVPTIIGFGMAFTMSAGLFELSAGAQIVTAAVIGVLLSNAIGFWGLLIGCVVVGLIMGVLNGGIYIITRIPSLVVSLGMVLVCEVIAFLLTGRSGYLSIKNDISFIGSTPNNFIIAAIIAILFYIIFYYTKFSYNIRVVGDNELIAKTMGVNVAATKFKAYIIGGLFFGVAAILEVCYSNSISVGTKMVSLSLVFKPMMGVMIGLQLLKFINNFVVTIFIGEISLALVFNGLIALGMRSTFQDIILGFFMLIIMAISMNREKMAKWNRKRKVKKVNAIITNC